jgi:cyclopropane fatty-acyl-phospholipid synthase-like methyltransferase
MAVFRKIGMQFKKPTGVLGKIVSNLMIIGNRSAYETVIKDLAIQPNDKILEIGYGPGIGIDLIAKKFESCDIYGIDFSGLMYRRATRRNKQVIKKNRVHLLFGDFVETEISMNCFDKIFCINVVYFWNDLQKPFERVKSLLKDDGMFCFYMAKKDDLNKLKFTKDDIFNKYSIEQILKALKSVEFKEVDYYFKKGYYIKAKK